MELDAVRTALPENNESARLNARAPQGGRIFYRRPRAGFDASASLFQGSCAVPVPVALELGREFDSPRLGVVKAPNYVPGSAKQNKA